MDQIFFYHYTRDELNEFARQGYAVVVPLASTEQHGHQLPVFTDSLICEHIATNAVRKAAEQVPILVTPVLTIGCSSHHLRFGGTLAYSSSTYMNMLKDIGESLITDGFHKILFLNGHGGNQSMMVQTANDLAVKYPVWTAFGSYSSIAESALKETGADEVGQVAGHAGGFETSLIMALRPDLVREDKFVTTHQRLPYPPYYNELLKHKELTGVDGFTDAPNLATAAKGRQYLTAIVGAVADWLVAMCRAMDDSFNAAK